MDIGLNKNLNNLKSNYLTSLSVSLIHNLYYSLRNSSSINVSDISVCVFFHTFRKSETSTCLGGGGIPKIKNIFFGPTYQKLSLETFPFLQSILDIQTYLSVHLASQIYIQQLSTFQANTR